MAFATSVKDGARLKFDGAYAGAEGKTETVKLKAHGMSVDLWRIENVRGSEGDDTVTLHGPLNRSGTIDLDDGNDAVHLGGAETYHLKLRGVETVTGVAGATLNLHGSSAFQTDGSVSIASTGRHNQAITFTDIVNDITLSLGRGKDKIILGDGLLFAVNGDNQLVAVKDGKTLTFEGYDPASSNVTIVVDGESFSYADFLSSDLIDTTPPAVVSVEASLAVIADANVGPTAFTVTVTFDQAMLAGGSADPVLTFGADVASTLTLASGSWNDAGTAYTATYAVADAGVDLNSITIDVSGAKDLATNPQQDYTAQIEFEIDTLDPTVSAFTEDNADGVVSDADRTVAYSVTFSEAVAALAEADLDIAGGTLAAGPVLADDGLSATFSVTATDGSTTDLVVGLKDTVLDSHGNALVVPTAVTLTVETINPTVTAFTEDNVDGLVSDADSTVAYTVTFSEAVAALVEADLDITGGAVSAGPVLADDGLSATFSVTATDGSTADLVVGLKDTVLDVNGNALVVPTALTLTVDTTNPTVAAFTEDNADGVVSGADSVVAYSVTFSKAVVALGADDLDIAGGSLSAGPVLAGDGLSATFSVTATDDSTADLVVGLKDTVVDANGNALVVPTAVTLTVDTTDPTVTSILRNTPTDLFTNDDSLVYRVTFSEQMAQVDAADFTVTGTTATITGVSSVSTGVYDITVAGGDLATLNADVTLGFDAAQNIVDAAGNALEATAPTSTNEPTFKVDNEAPTVSLTDIGVVEWGYMFFGTGMETVNGESSDSYGVTADNIDWSKFWIELDGSGTADITFTAADISWIDPTEGSFWFGVSSAKIEEINSAVDGVNDLIVVDQGFWGDLAGNVQLVGGNYSETAVDVVSPP